MISPPIQPFSSPAEERQFYERALAQSKRQLIRAEALAQTNKAFGIRERIARIEFKLTQLSQQARG